MTATAEKTEPKMMIGTNGYHDYFVIARKGNIALGIKPNNIAPGDRFGHPGTTWFGARLRAAPAGDLFEAEGEGNVVQFQKKFDLPAEAWDEVEWEKSDGDRASTTIGSLIRGTLSGSIDDAKMVLEEMKDGKLANKLATYLTELAGAENMILSIDELSAILTDKVYGKIAAKLEKMIEARKIVETEMEKNIGTFGMQAKMLKKAYEKMQESVEDAEPADNDEAGSDD